MGSIAYVEECYAADRVDLRSAGLRQWASDDPEPQVVMADFGLKRIAVSEVEQRDAGAVPRTAAGDASLVHVLPISFFVNVWMFAVERPSDRACPFDDVARQVINAVTVRLIIRLRIGDTNLPMKNAGSQT